MTEQDDDNNGIDIRVTDNIDSDPEADVGVNNEDNTEETGITISTTNETTDSDDTSGDRFDEDYINDDGTVDISDNYSGNVTLVGTVHVSERTRDRVQDTIRDKRPSIVAIELDPERLSQMFERRADFVGGEESSDEKGGILGVLRDKQKETFDGDGVLKPGEADMLPAVDEGVEINAEIALIDMSVDNLKSQVKNNAYSNGKLDLEIFNKSFGEISDAVKGFVQSRKDIAEQMKEEGKGIEAVVDNMEDASMEEIKGQMEPMQKIAPEVIDALIDERDKYMAGRLHWLRKNNKDVVAVMGRGHIEGVYNYLNDPDSIPEEYVVEPDWYEYTNVSLN